MTIDDVAIALSQWRKDINLGKPAWESLSPDVKDAYREQANAAIEAYEQAKKPTPLPTYCRFCNGLNGRHYQDCSVSPNEQAKNMGECSTRKDESSNALLVADSPANTALDSNQNDYEKALLSYYEEKKRRDNNATALVKKLVDAISYAIWQHECGGTPEHNHWTGVCREALTEANAYLERTNHDK